MLELAGYSGKKKGSYLQFFKSFTLGGKIWYNSVGTTSPKIL
jgi:hypothetical protein